MVCVEKYTNDYSITHVFFAVKQWMRKNWHKAQAAEYPEVFLLESSAVVTAEKCEGWFIHSGYNM